MKIRARSYVSGVLAGLILSFGALSNQASAAETLKIQSIWQPGSVLQEIFLRFCDNFNAASGEELQLECMPVKSVVAHNETIDAVSSGILQGHHSFPGYFSGRDPAFGLLGELNAGYEDPYQFQMWYLYEGGLELARELYAEYNLYYVGPVFWGVESIPLKEPVNSLADFEGLKLRVPEGPSSDMFRKMGVSPVNIPGAEVYTSLERGVIDGADWGTLAMNERLGFHEIAPYALYPGFHSMPAGEVSINLDTWNSLSESQQELLEMAVRDFSRDMIQTNIVQDIEARKAARDKGVELIDLSSEDRAKIRQMAAEVWEEYGGANEMSQRILDSHMAWLEKLGLL